MEQNDLYPETQANEEDFPQQYEKIRRKTSKLPLISTIFSILTFITTVIILVVLLTTSANRPMMGVNIREGEMFPNGEAPFNIDENMPGIERLD